MKRSARIMAENLRILRSIKRLTQTDLAKASRVSQSTIAQIEAGTKSASLDTLDKIALALKVAPGALVTKQSWECA